MSFLKAFTLLYSKSQHFTCLSSPQENKYGCLELTANPRTVLMWPVSESFNLPLPSSQISKREIITIIIIVIVTKAIPILLWQKQGKRYYLAVQAFAKTPEILAWPEAQLIDYHLRVLPHVIDHFTVTVVCLVAWPLNEKAEGDLVLTETSLLLLWNQSRPQSSSLLRMNEAEKSSGEPWNKHLSHWFSRGTKNRHIIGLFKWKILINALLCERCLLQICEEGKAFCF